MNEAARPGVPSQDILDQWDRINRDRPRREPLVKHYGPEAPRTGLRTTDIPAAVIFNKTRGAGVNIERGAGWGEIGWDSLLSAGVCWARFFYPWRPDLEMNGPGSAAPPSDEQLSLLVEGAEGGILAGLDCVVIDMTDVLDLAPALEHIDTIEHVVRRMARLVKASRVLNTHNTAFGPVNEYAGEESDAEWKPFRDRMNAACREELPEHALVTGTYYWKYMAYLPGEADPCPPGDPNWLVDVHTYEQLNWEETADQLLAWMTEHQRPVICGEIGPHNWYESLPADQWEARYRAQSPLWNVIPLAPWAVTYGSALRLNTWEDLALDPIHDDWMQDMADTEAQRPEIGDGEPGEPGEPEPGEPFHVSLIHRTDHVLTFAVTADGPVQWVPVESQEPWTWVGQPTAVQPGEVVVTLSDYSHFVKWTDGTEWIDSPTPEEAAAYVPTDGTTPPGEGDCQEAVENAFSMGWHLGWRAGLAKGRKALRELQPPPAPTVPG